jgi:MATE family multidrug resistance protein
MGTSGMTAQALGRRNLTEIARILVRSAMVAEGIATVLIVLQVPLLWLMFWLIEPTEDVAPLAATYFRIVIWGAPASLALFSLTGWFIGMQNTRIPMAVSILQNVVNIVASLTLVYGVGMKIEGVAIGTVIAQYAGLLMAVGMLLRGYSRIFRNRHNIWNLKGIRAFFSVNRDIFLRTVCLVAVNLYFTSAGARQGAVVLSANTVMLQLFLFFSYFMDGFAYAGEALGGKAYGAHNGIAFRETLHRLWMWMLIVTVAYTLLYIIAGPWIVALLTDESMVLDTSREYLWWAWLIPIAGCVAFIWDGIFIGITATRGMLVSSFLSALTFLAVYLLTESALGNHGLWLAQIAYLAMRGVLQTIWYRLKLISTIG